MSAMSTDFDPQRLWQTRPSTQPPVTLDDVRRRARKFHRHARRRHIEAWIAVIFQAVMLPIFLYLGWTWGRNWLTLTGGALTLAGGILGCWRWGMMNSAEPIPDEDKSLVEAYRRNLVRLRDVRRNGTMQVFLCCLPGIVIAYSGAFIEHSGSGPADAAARLFIIRFLMVAGLITAVTVLVNRLIARNVQRRIDEL